MSARVEYFYDFVSPYSYLAQSQVPALAERCDAEIVYRPFLLGGRCSSIKVITSSTGDGAKTW